jgi:hypothetical protein
MGWFVLGAVSMLMLVVTWKRLSVPNASRERKRRLESHNQD